MIYFKSITFTQSSQMSCSNNLIRNMFVINSLSFSLVFTTVSTFIFISLSFLTFHMWQGLARFMQICETATRVKFSQIMRTFLLRQVHVYKKPTKIVNLPECVLSRGREYFLFLSFLSFDLHLHPSSFYFDMNFGKASSGCSCREKHATLENR